MALDDYDHLDMQTYKVFVHGQGMVVRRWWIFRRQVGFYVTRFVAAPDPSQAAALALESVRGEPRLALAATGAPVLSVEDVQPVDGPVSAWAQPGIVFYPSRADHVP